MAGVVPDRSLHRIRMKPGRTGRPRPPHPDRINGWGSRWVGAGRRVRHARGCPNISNWGVALSLPSGNRRDPQSLQLGPRAASAGSPPRPPDPGPSRTLSPGPGPHAGGDRNGHPPAPRRPPVGHEDPSGRARRRAGRIGVGFWEKRAPAADSRNSVADLGSCLHLVMATSGHYLMQGVLPAVRMQHGTKCWGLDVC